MLTVLLADDNRNIREYCRRDLEDEGYRVIAVGDGAAAIAAALRERPDLVVLDVCMPVTDGLDALSRIKDFLPDAPVILFTASDGDCLDDPRSQQALACVEKTADLTELKRVLATATHYSPYRQNDRLGLPPASHRDSKTASLGRRRRSLATAGR